MRESRLEREIFGKKWQKPALQHILQATIENKGTANVEFFSSIIKPGQRYAIEPDGTYFELDLSQLTFTGQTPEENNVLVVFKQLNTCS